MQLAHSNHSLNGRIRNLMVFSGFIALLFLLLSLYYNSRGYRNAVQEGQYQAESLVSSLADHAALTFLVSDMTLRRATERHVIHEMMGQKTDQYLSEKFRVWLEETPQIAGIALVDTNGKIHLSAHEKEHGDWLGSGKSIEDPKLFEAVKQMRDSQLFIGLLTQSEQSYLLLARKISNPDGTFGGMIVVVIPPDYFSDFYHSIAAHQQHFMVMTLAGESGEMDTLFVSSTNDSHHLRTHWQRYVQHQNGHGVKTTPQDNVTIRVDQSDDGLVVIGSKSLKNLPLTVHVLIHEQDFLAHWKRVRNKDIGFLLLFAVFGSVLFFFAIAMARQIFRAEESESKAILASQAKSEFLANMSHELRTPLNAIIGYSEMMNSEYFGPLNDRQKDRIHDVHLCGTHLLQLINDILEFSKGEAGKLDLSEENVDVTAVVGECARISHGKARSKEIRLTTSIEPDLPEVWGDRRKITQIILNLITNAIKFTDKGGTVSVSAKMDGHRAIHLVVSDTGIGMSEEDIPMALSVFGQAHRSHSHEGTGLGLPLCKMYTELHGGRLILTSEKGKGTTVRIILPHQRTLEE